MAKKCRLCGVDIPEERWASSWYCTGEHYYEAKKKRGSTQYHRLKKQHDALAKNEAILQKLLVVNKYGGRISMEDLKTEGLELGFSTGNIAGKYGEIWTMVGNHAYYINPKTKTVSICKVK